LITPLLLIVNVTDKKLDTAKKMICFIRPVADLNVKIKTTNYSRPNSEPGMMKN